MDEKTLAKINVSNRATLASEYIMPKFEDQMQKIVSSMMHQYRSESLNEKKLMSMVGQLVGLDDLRQSILTDIKIGQKARGQ